jgi:hypothetical protein
MAVQRQVGQVRAAFPPFVTASQWISVFESTWNRAQRARGLDTNDEGTIAPRLTNAEAVALVRAWKSAATAARFPLWYQFAAAAYGWDPPDNDTFNTSAKQAARLYETEINVQLWLALHRLALDLDDTAEPPRLDFDGALFDDVMVVASVRARLQEDGAEAAFKIPIPACRDKKTGRMRFPRRGDKPGDCDVVLIDDPITYIGKNLGAAALILGLVWLLAQDNKPRRQRRRAS